MYLYNITIKAGWPFHEEWLQWMKGTYISRIMLPGDFHDFRFYRIMQLDDTEGPTYALQLYTESMEKYNHFVEHCKTEIDEMQYRTWGHGMITFATLMKSVH